jgi:hypothetical protein
MKEQGGAMIRHLALLLVAISTPLAAATPLPRSFTITSFDRIRVEGPYAVVLSVGTSPSARAEGSASALDRIDLRVEGRTLIVRQRSASGSQDPSGPVRIRVGTPDLRSASLLGAGSLEIDRLRGLSVDLWTAGSGSLAVRDLQADRVRASIAGSGSMILAGTAKTAALSASGTPMIVADKLLASEVTILAEGSAEVVASARERAKVTAAGTAQVRLGGSAACQLSVQGSASVEGCDRRR